MTRVRDKVAIVTGGAAGLGAAIVRRLVNEGARVLITDIQNDAGRRLADELGCDFLNHDVTDEAKWESVVAHAQERYGALHILVNNAGIEGSLDINTPENTRLCDWQTVHRVNVDGVFLGCRAAIPALRRSGGGAIVNMSSTAALVAMAEFTAYGASKAAVRHLTRSVALHCAKDRSKIRCNSVHPGPILTPMLHRLIAATAETRGVSVDQVMNELRSTIPQGEFPLPEDIASAVLFLVSDEALHITGLAMVVDGGSTVTAALT
ncbi:MAG: glucose 1-dehydrogenase [Steroidobacteraceae bacterium]